MIGFIALAGIIVRNSILLVDFTVQQRKQGVPVRDAVILSCKARTRPILITAFALVAGSSVILFDPIFQGMAVSLLFGVLVSTLLTLVVIPMGCVASRGGPPPGSDKQPAPTPMEPEARKQKASLGKGIRNVGETLAHVVPAVGRTFVAAVVGLLATLGMLLKFLISKLTSRKQRKPAPAATAAGNTAPSREEKETVAEEHIARLEEVEEPAPAPQNIPQKTTGNTPRKKSVAKKKGATRKKTGTEKKAPVRKKTTTVKNKDATLNKRTTKKKTAAKTKKKSAPVKRKAAPATTKKTVAPKKAATPKKKTAVKKSATTAANKATLKKTAAKSAKGGQNAAGKKERRGIRLTPSKFE
jgi:hypothetical protein